MSQKLVSIIIPNYNSKKFIEETLQSVFNQTYANIEIIIVDDGSNDGSYEYISQLNKENLKIYKNPLKGACTARNYGYKLSKGDYIQFLDADDVLSPKKIEMQVSALNDNPKTVAVCNTKHFYNTIENGVITDWDFLYSTDDPEKFLLNLYGAYGINNMVQTSAWLTPRSLIEEAGLWDESLFKDQDGEFFCRVVTRANKVMYVPEIINYYRKHIKGSNIANQKREIHIKSQLQALNSKLNQFYKRKETKAYNNAMALQYKIIAVDAYPEFKDIYQEAMSKVKEFGGTDYEPLLGGKIIEVIKSIFGWRNAKKLSVFVHKYIKS